MDDPTTQAPLAKTLSITLNLVERHAMLRLGVLKDAGVGKKPRPTIAFDRQVQSVWPTIVEGRRLRLVR